MQMDTAHLNHYTFCNAILLIIRCPLVCGYHALYLRVSRVELQSAGGERFIGVADSVS